MTGAIIFSRFNSSRLPGKALMEISGRSLIGRVLDRTRKISNIDNIVIATSDHESDNIIVQFAKSEGVDFFRGSLENVASRALKTCEEFQLDSFVRICGDRPFFDPDLISLLVSIYNDSSLDVVTTTFPRIYPPGLTGEVVRTEALRNAVSLMSRHEDKEHVTSFFYRNPSKFLIRNVVPSKKINNLDGINLCVDTNEDLKRARWISSCLSSNEIYCVDKIISLANEWNLLKINN